MQHHCLTNLNQKWKKSRNVARKIHVALQGTSANKVMGLSTYHAGRHNSSSHCWMLRLAVVFVKFVVRKNATKNFVAVVVNIAYAEVS
jgi:hypothetical protein